MTENRVRSGSAGLARLAGLGGQFVVAILLCLFIGQWLDRKFDTAPVFLYVGVFAGAASGFISMYRGLMAEQRRAEAESKAKPGAGAESESKDAKRKGP